MSFNDLPNESLDCILNDSAIFSLQDRIKFRAVSYRWCTIIEKSLKVKTTKLTIRQSGPKLNAPNPPHEPDDLILFNSKYFNTELFQLLAHLFPSISELTVVLRSKKCYDHLPELLSKFRSTLKVFSLYGKNYYPRTQHSADTSTIIAATLNSLTKLTGLHLFARGLNTYLSFLLGSTLGRLEQFSLYDYGLSSPGPAIFCFLSSRCIKLNLNEACFFMRSTSVDASLTHLRLYGATESGLVRLCTKLTALTSLNIESNNNYLYPYILRNLSLLTQLTELKMVYSRCPRRLMYLFDPPQPTDQPLVTIMRLDLYVKSCCDQNFDGAHFYWTLARWFPCLEQLTLKCPDNHFAPLAENRGIFSNSTVVNIVNIDRNERLFWE